MTGVQTCALPIYKTHELYVFIPEDEAMPRSASAGTIMAPSKASSPRGSTSMLIQLPLARSLFLLPSRVLSDSSSHHQSTRTSACPPLPLRQSRSRFGRCPSSVKRRRASKPSRWTDTNTSVSFHHLMHVSPSCCVWARCFVHEADSLLSQPCAYRRWSPSPTRTQV